MTRRNALWACAAVLALGLGWVGGQLLPNPKDTRAFQLTDTTGKIFNSRELLEDQGYLITFGYTFCPDVCPTTMAYLAGVLEHSKGQVGQRIPAFFVTVDPQRDTPERLSQYVKYFSEDITGLTGTTAELTRAAEAFSIYFSRVDGTTEDDYLMDHSSGVLVVNADHQLVAVIRDGEPLDSALEKITKAL